LTNQRSKAPASQADPVRPPAPRPIVIAVQAMYAGAALTAVGIVISVISLTAGGTAVLKSSYPHQTAAQLHTTETSLIVIAAFSGLIEIGAWLLVARANSGGLKWARIVACVLFALNTWNLATHLVRVGAVANLVYTVLIWLIGLAAVILLWHRESSAYFAQPATAAATSGRPARRR
jgi:hypothetical protein